MVRITKVDPGSRADRAGIRAGDDLLSINGEEIRDVLDYRFYLADKKIDLALLRDGTPYTVTVKKGTYDDIGLDFATPLMDEKQSCRNKCVFCFIDQLPKGMRKSLYFKDDDSRLSFLHGNYITLTNMTERDIDRIIKMRFSPINVSVHTTNPELRVRMMKNKRAGAVLAYLPKLAASGIELHCQIVLCRGLNDGDVLRQTLSDLSSLAPACGSVAIVPVGVTKFRDGLPALGTFDEAQSAEIIDRIEPMQREYLARFGTRLVFLSDEWYLNAHRTLPESEAYEDYEQIENGVGLLRMFEDDFRYALSERAPLKRPRTVSVAGGTAAYPFFRELYRELLPYGIETEIHPVPNLWFGGNVHVAGLVTGSDLVSELKGKALESPLLIPKNMLRETENVFLDGMTLSDAEAALGVPIRTFSDGTEFISCVFEE